MFGTRKLFLSLHEEKRNGGNGYVVLAPQTDGERNHLEHAHHTGMGLGRAVERWSAPFSAPALTVQRNVSPLPRRL